MLKQRVITGIIMIFVVLMAVFFASADVFCFLTAALFLVGAWEWAFLSGLSSMASRIVYVILVALLFVLLWYSPLLLILFLAALFWLFAMYLILLYPQKTTIWSPIWVRALMGLFVLGPSWLALNVLHSSSHGVYLIMTLFLIVWGADVGAYFSGRFWGRRALMPKVSPKKTIEGFLGGLVLSLLLASLMSSKWDDLTVLNWFMLLIGVVLINIYAVAGDLFESLLKRYCDVKDSGKMLPGHGGVLDRIDSLTAAAPIFLTGLILMWFW